MNQTCREIHQMNGPQQTFLLQHNLVFFLNQKSDIYKHTNQKEEMRENMNPIKTCLCTESQIKKMK